MILSKHNNPRSTLIYTLIIAIFWIVLGLAFDRFWLYHSQNRVLKPADYSVRVISSDDYARLSNSTEESVKLSKGSTRKDSLPSYKSLGNGEQYVRVITNGTAAFFPRLLEAQMPILLFLVMGLAYEIMQVRNIHKNKKRNIQLKDNI